MDKTVGNQFTSSYQMRRISINQNLNNPFSPRNIFKVAHVSNIRDWMRGNRVMRCYRLPERSVVPHFSFYLSFPSAIPNNQIWLLPTSTSIYVQLYVQMKKKQLEQRFITRQPISLVQTNSKKLCSIYLASFKTAIPSMRFYYIYHDFTRYFCRHVQFRISFPPLLSTSDRIRSNQVARNGPILFWIMREREKIYIYMYKTKIEEELFEGDYPKLGSVNQEDAR